jgi:hypothetical protein
MTSSFTAVLGRVYFVFVCAPTRQTLRLAATAGWSTDAVATAAPSGPTRGSPLPLPPGCGAECAQLHPGGAALLPAQPSAAGGFYCERESGSLAGMLRCRSTWSSYASGVGPGGGHLSFVLDPDNREQVEGLLGHSPHAAEILSGQLLAAGLEGRHGMADDDTAAAEQQTPMQGGSQDLPEQQQHTEEALASGVPVAWFRECGCTGLEIEASHLIAPLARLLARETRNGTEEAGDGSINGGAWYRSRSGRAAMRRRVFTNSCSRSCRGGYSPDVQQLLDAVAVPAGAFWRRVEDTLRGCGANVAQLRAFQHLSTQVKRRWGCVGRTASSVVLALVVHVGPVSHGGGPCTWPEPARWLRAVPNVLTVSRSMYEVDGLPPAAVARCNLFDEVWVPASFNIRTFSRGSTASQQRLPGRLAGHSGTHEKDQLRPVSASGVAVTKLFTLPEGFDPSVFACSRGRRSDSHDARDNGQLHSTGWFDWAQAAERGSTFAAAPAAGTAMHKADDTNSLKEHPAGAPSQANTVAPAQAQRRRPITGASLLPEQIRAFMERPPSPWIESVSHSSVCMVSVARFVLRGLIVVTSTGLMQVNMTVIDD